MSKFIDFIEVQHGSEIDKDELSTCKVQEGELILWDGKTFRRKDGSKYPVDADVEGMPDRYMIGWIQEWKRLNGSTVKFAALDLPETKGTFEQRQNELDIIWRSSTSSIMYLVCPNKSNKPIVPCLGFVSKSKWNDKEWAFIIHG